MKTQKPERISRKDGKNCFVEVLDSAFPLGKVRLDFVSYDAGAAVGSRITNNIPIYLDVEKFLMLGDKFRCEGKKYLSSQEKGFSAFFEVSGGTSATALSKRGQSRPDKKSISRVMMITRGQKGYFLTAVSGPGEESKTGLIVPLYGKKKGVPPEHKVSLCLDHDSMMEIVVMVEHRYNAYLCSEYIRHPIEERDKTGDSTKTFTTEHTTEQKKKSETNYETSFGVSDEDLPF